MRRSTLALGFASLLAIASGRSLQKGPQTRLGLNGVVDLGLQWPFDQERHPARVYQTYGQGERMSPTQLHLGLDLAVPAGTPVYSPVSGVVCLEYRNLFGPHQQGIGIRILKNGKEHFVKLMHLERSSIPVSLGDRVEQGDFVGTVHPWPKSDPTYVSHLHIQVGDPAVYAFPDQDTQPGYRNALDSIYNPLDGMHGQVDEVPPTLVSLSKDSPLIFRPLVGKDPAAWALTKDWLEPDQLKGMVDIEIAVADGFSKAFPEDVIAPRSVRVVIQRNDDSGEVVLERWLVLGGGSLAPKHCPPTWNPFARQFYVAPPWETADPKGFVFHLTGLLGDAGQDWPPRAFDTSVCGPGDYLVSVFASDTRHQRVPLGTQKIRVIPD